MKSFLHGKRSIDAAALRSPTSGGTPSGLGSAAPHGVPAAGVSPHVEVVKQGDKVMRIVVTCSCGERTEIECLYPPGQ
jgi:hypothetical protein